MNVVHDVQETTLAGLLKELGELNAQYEALQDSLLLQGQGQSRGLEHEDIFNSGDTGFILCCSAIVMLMSLPGISLFYSGAVKIKHIMATFIQTMAISSVISVLWMVCGYSLAFAPALANSNGETRMLGDFSRAWLLGMDIDSVHQLAPTIPETAFCMFQLSNAIIACALIIGGFACRTKFISVLLFIAMWLLLVFCPLSQMHRHPSGWLQKMHVLDYAGGNVVHISAGITALIASYYIGPRSNIQEKERFESRNILLCVWGACFVLIGWFGFNMGASYNSGFSSSRALIITMVGASSSTMSWIAVEWYRTGTPSILGILCGAIAGLVSISAGVGYIDHTGAFVTGLCTGCVCYLVVEKERTIRAVDDPLNTFSLNFVGGLTGGLMVGFFARFRNDSAEPHGAFYGNPRQVAIQLLGIAVTTAWTAVMSGLILVFLDKTVGLRVPLAHETIGLDIAQLHDTIIDMPSKKMKSLIKQTVVASSSHANDELDMVVKDDLDMVNRGESESEGVGDGDGDNDGTVNDTVNDTVNNTHTNQPAVTTQISILSGNH